MMCTINEFVQSINGTVLSDCHSWAPLIHHYCTNDSAAQFEVTELQKKQIQKKLSVYRHLGETFGQHIFETTIWTTHVGRWATVIESFG